MTSGTIRRTKPSLPAEPKRTAWAIWVEPGVPVFLILVALLVWGLELPTVDLRRMGDLGLLPIFPTLYVVIGILIVSFALVIRQPKAREPLLLLHVVALILIVHGTPNILYGTLRYSWAWKHIAIVDYIQRHGSVDPSIAYLSPYHSWPGFFILNALVTQVAGFASSLAYAGWGPVFFNLIDIGALRLVLKTFTRDSRLIWLSIWFFYVTNWVGQDYFSPQAMSYFLYLVVLGICLTWFKRVTPPSKTALQRLVLFDRPASLLHQLLRRAADTTVPPPTSLPFQRLGLMIIVILILSVLAFTHQLTPYMLTSALALLVIFQWCNARNLPLLAFVLATTWVVYMTVAFLKGNLSWVIQSIGQLTGTIEGTFIDLSVASPGQVVIAYIDRGMTVLVIMLALLGGIQRLRQGYWDLPAAFLVIAPLPVLVANSYGGEMVFRVYLFVLPSAAFFVAALLFTRPGLGAPWRTVGMIVLLSGVLWAGFSFGYYGKERQNYFTPNEVGAAEYVDTVAPAGSLLLDGSWNWPLYYRNYEFFNYASILTFSWKERIAITQDPVGMLSRRMGNSDYPAVYLIITRGQIASIDMTGWMPAGSLQTIEQALTKSSQFKIVYSNADAKVFMLADRVQETK